LQYFSPVKFFEPATGGHSVNGPQPPDSLMTGLEELCSRGHDLNKLVYSYPISVVKALIEAVQWNKRIDILLHAQAVAVGVSNSLDSAFGKGKGKILDKFQKSLFKASKRSKNSEDAANKILGAFGLPNRTIQNGK